MCVDKTAPVSLRERVSFSPDKLDQALDSLLAQPMVQGGVVLSTCNRTELYLSVEERDDPVSYTHLDVYKRQALRCGGK